MKLKFFPRLSFLSVLLLFGFALFIAAAGYQRVTAALLDQPTVGLQASMSVIKLPCPSGPGVDMEVDLTTSIMHFGDDAQYSYSVTGGRLSGEGRKTKWDLTGVQPGTYSATVTVQDAKRHTSTSSVRVEVVQSSGCAPPCPSLQLSCGPDVKQGEVATFSVADIGNVKYNWIVSEGATISQGQGTSSIQVTTTGLGGKTITATVRIESGPECQLADQCSILVQN